MQIMSGVKPLKPPSDERPPMSIGRLAREVHINPDTLRMWERRYGAPKSIRLPSGHRRYTAAEARRLGLAVQAMRLGRRPSEVVPASTEKLLEILGQAKAAESTVGERRRPSREESLARWVAAARQLDAQTLAHLFHQEWAELGPLQFLEERVGPVLEEVGEAWRCGHLTVAQEHFLSEQLSDFLSSQWRRLSERAPRAPFMLATLPGDLHQFGLIMCAVVSAVADHAVVFLGPHTPPEELVRTAIVHRPAACVVSLSKTCDPAKAREWLRELREGLPEEIPLVAGGGGLPEVVEGVLRFETLRSFHEWAAQQP